MLLWTLLFLFIISQSFGNDDYYKLLNVPKNADTQAIRKAFKKIALNYHPDKNSDDPEAHMKFIKYTTAYEILKDPESRKKYDLYGEEGFENNMKSNQKYYSWNYYKNNFGIYDDNPEIVTFTSSTFEDYVFNSEKIWFINFYSPMCSHCHHLAPTWRKIAKDFQGAIRIGAVNCEDDFKLCHQIQIQSYPSLLFYPKNSVQGTKYTGSKTYDELANFIISKLDVNIKKITKSQWKDLIQNKKKDKPTLVFICCENLSLSTDERLKIAATFENIVEVGIINCDNIHCDKLDSTTGAVFFTNTKNSDPILFNNIDNNLEMSSMIQKILELLPEPQDISAEDFENIKTRMVSSDEKGWLFCFYIGQEVDLQLKSLPSIIRDVNLAKINCGRYSQLCNNLNINRYPIWGLLKPGGAFELNHGKTTLYEIAKFVESSLKAKNVWALSTDKILSILNRKSGNEVWFLDWYTPWCPPCMTFLSEIRKASLEFEKSIQFGTIDCTVHSVLCQQYNIRVYPTGMIINGSNTIQFQRHSKTAANIVEFIKESMNPSVIELDKDNFYKTVGKKNEKTIWVVDYYAPWCKACQLLEPEWIAVAKTMTILPDVKIARVNCEINGQLCQSQGIRSYPSIFLYPRGSEGLNSVVMFNNKQPRDQVNLLEWITKFLPYRIEEFNDNNLERKVFKSKKDIWLIDYFAPWCGHCQTLKPHFLIASQLFNGTIRFGQFDCSFYRSECAKIGVKSYPTLLLYTPNSGKESTFKEILAFSAKDIFNQVLNNLQSQKIHDEL